MATLGAVAAGLLVHAWRTGQGWPLALAGAAVWLLMTAVRAGGNLFLRAPVRHAWLEPLAGVFLAAAMSWSAWSRRCGGGAVWRGRRYKAR